MIIGGVRQADPLLVEQPETPEVPCAALALAFERHPGPVLLLQDGRVLLANAAARVLAARPPIGLDLEAAGLLHPAGVPLGERADTRAWLTHRGRRRLLGWTDVPLPDGRLLVSGIDYTDRQPGRIETRPVPAGPVAPGGGEHLDALTGLATRRGLLTALQRALDGQHPVVVLVCDLDAFGTVNRRHGHARADQVLQAVAGRLVRGVRPGDLVGRLGADAFAVVARDLSADLAPGMVTRLTATVTQPVMVAGSRVGVGASIGWASGTPGSAAAELLTAATQSMAQRRGRRRLPRPRGS